MLDWLTGNGRNTQSVNAAKDGTEVPEPPQTPAPVFAVRAFKTALFGTPQETREKDVTAHQQNGHTIAGRNNSKADKVAPNGSTTTNRPPLGCADANASRPAAGETDGGASPLKPAGIMLTPGIGPSRRKTVSFGASVLDNEEKRSFRARKAELTDESSTSTSNLRKSNTGPTTTESGRTRLTKTLYESRDHVDNEAGGENRPFQFSDVKGTAKVPPSSDVGDNDITLDMDNPRSTSGRYWKSEFENYQEDAEQAITRLRKYRQIAKSYVRQKDSESVSLAAKLHDESQKVKRLEAEISDLVATLTSARTGDHGNESEQAQLVEKLASHTGLALEYKTKITQLQTALEKDRFPSLGENAPKTHQGTSPRTAETILQTRQELKKARKQVQEINELRTEMSELRSKARDAEERAEKLEEENISLTKELSRTRERLKEMEKQRKVQDDNRKSAYREARDRIYVSEAIGVEGERDRQTLKVEFAMNSEGSATSKPHTVTHSLRGVNLPPERAAAAIARLEQRKTERKRLRMQEHKEDTGRG